MAPIALRTMLTLWTKALMLFTSTSTPTSPPSPHLQLNKPLLCSALSHLRLALSPLELSSQALCLIAFQLLNLRSSFNYSGKMYLIPCLSLNRIRGSCWNLKVLPYNNIYLTVLLPFYLTAYLLH